MNDERSIAASDVAQAILDVTGPALLDGDFDAFKQCFQVPQTMATMAGPIHMETEEDMQRAFDEMHLHLAALNVTEIYRRCVSATYNANGQITATHMSELISDGRTIKGPYPVFIVLEKIDQNWKVIASEYAIQEGDGQAEAIIAGDASQRPLDTEDIKDAADD